MAILYCKCGAHVSAISGCCIKCMQQILPPTEKSYKKEGTMDAIILIGLSGSGKSTVAKLLAGDSGIICSTDAFFMVDGVYKWDRLLLAKNHELNQIKFETALKESIPVVISDNTNLRRTHRRWYMEAAKNYKYNVHTVLIGNPTDPEHQKLCASRNTHGLMLEDIMRQAKSFEAD